MVNRSTHRSYEKIDGREGEGRRFWLCEDAVREFLGEGGGEPIGREGGIGGCDLRIVGIG